jgi:alkylation response protein AidB-like acyl-CoA dehydrogenase
MNVQFRTVPIDAKLLDNVAAIARQDLAPIVTRVDREGLYPEAVLRKLGSVGAFGQHLPGRGKDFSLGSAIEAMAAVGATCLSTAFCMWCQDALGWYIAVSANAALKERLLDKVAVGEVLGGTGLSNPMKHLFGIEPIRLKGKRVAGGYRVSGALPWVSNLGPDHHFGAVFQVVDDPARFVMAIVSCASDGVTLAQNNSFLALDGTRTFGVQMRDLFTSDDVIVADPIDDYLRRIRGGFVLLQAGMAFGLIEASIAMMEQVKSMLGHVNKFLPQQPEQFREDLAGMRALVGKLCETPFEADPSYWKQVIEARLAAGEATVAAAHAAMLHQGARGYVAHAAAQRRLREAYFVAIVTPATKQLRKMLSDMAA